MAIVSQNVPEQLWLDLQGGAAIRRPAAYPDVHNFYFALLPEPAAAEAARRRAIEAGLPGRLHPAHLLHVSLAGLGRYASLPPYRLANAQASAKAVCLPCFDITFDRILSFGKGPYPHLVLASKSGSEEIIRLCWRLTAGPAAISPGQDNRMPRFAPHMTLVYGGRRIKEVLLAEPIRWTVREFVLVQSFYGQGRHEYLGRWPLGPPDTQKPKGSAGLPTHPRTTLAL